MTKINPFDIKVGESIELRPGDFVESPNFVRGKRGWRATAEGIEFFHEPSGPAVSMILKSVADEMERRMETLIRESGCVPPEP